MCWVDDDSIGDDVENYHDIVDDDVENYESLSKTSPIAHSSYRRCLN